MLRWDFGVSALSSKRARFGVRGPGGLELYARSEACGFLVQFVVVQGFSAFWM